MQVDRLIICVFLEKDENIYLQRLPHYFPLGRYLWQGPPLPNTPSTPHPHWAGSQCPLPSSLTAPPHTLTRNGKRGLACCVAAH